MREANWDEIFQRRPDDAPGDDELRSFLPWEEWLTLLTTAMMFFSVAHSIDSADWVSDMPSLYPICFTGLLVGYVLSKVRLPELLLHPVALFAGATVVFLQLLAVVPGGSVAARTDTLLDRMYVWWSAATQDGISNDTLPFVLLVLVLTWLGAYASAWAVFRWRNAWLALIPGGTALMWNISFIPGQFNESFVVFVFAAVLLIMRMHVARKESEWSREGVVYPEFISLSVLNATFWVAIGLLLLALVLPRPERSDTASERWQSFTEPYVSRFAPFARLFISVNAKRPIDVHNLEDALALQGKISLTDREAARVNVEITPEMAAYLRSQAFDEYTATGWKVNVEGNLDLAPGEETLAGAPATAEGARRDVTVDVTVAGNNDDFIYSLGQPLTSSEPATADLGGDPVDVSALKPGGRLREGDTYTVTGSVAVVSIEQLQAAGDDYPAWTGRYLQLPDRLPDRVHQKAREVTRGTDTPYEAAAQIERYLRSFPIDYKVPAAPPGQDSVDYFLFDAQRGYFDYHASAMAVMLRSLGIPARVAAGYVLDPVHREQDGVTYDVTERSAFAWPEVWFPGIGWVEFNPTPSQPRIARPGTLPEQSERANPSDRGLRDDLDLGELEEIPGEEVNRVPADTAADAGDGGDSAWRPFLVVGAVGFAALLLAGAGRMAWSFGLAGLPQPAQVWEKTLRLARWGKAGARPSETPREFATRLTEVVPGTDDVRYLAATYERSTFGQKQISDEESERVELAWRNVRNRLLRRVLRWRA
jgi:transglutaminase-like putative cysteine protease